MQAQGYRSLARPDAYDPSRRVRPCDACGAGLFVGEAAGRVRCEQCRHEQELPAARPLAIAASSERDESARLAKLRTQLDHQWLTPKSVVRFAGNVLEEEIPEARRVWVELRQKLEADPGDAQKGLELMCVTFGLHAALPSQTYEQRLARRAIAEASAEAQADPLLRQKTLYNVVVGAVRAAEYDHARGWLARMDPKSRGLDADSSYRVSAAVLATALGDPSEVLEILGRDAESVPIHLSSRVLGAVLRATALEKLDRLEAAVDVLYAEVLRRHSALAQIMELVSGFPRDWQLCERSLPLASERDRDRLIENVPSRATAVGPLAVLAVSALSAAPVLGDWHRWLAVGVGVVLALVAATIHVRDTRRRREIVRGAIYVRGRVVSVRRVGSSTLHALELCVERPDQPDVVVTTYQPLAARISRMQLEGRSFDALWNPAHPGLFPRITINVSAEDLKPE